MPLYVATCGWLTIAGLDDSPQNLVVFLVVAGLFWLGIATGSWLLITGTKSPRGSAAWLRRAAGWLILAAIAVPFVSGGFILGPVLLLCLPAWVPLRRT